MKTSRDPRHKLRQQLVSHLFASQFQHHPDSIVKPIWDHLPVIDALISHSAPEWPIDKLNHIDLAILRLAVYELTVDKKQPLKVIIDEAVELAKEYGAESSPKFINGALGNLVATLKLSET